MSDKFVILTRELSLVNTDPQRRCYDGAYFSSELAWQPWQVLDRVVDQEKLNEKLKFWTELNDYAVSQRGAGAKREFKVEIQK